jgi:hypothetical protein
LLAEAETLMPALEVFPTRFQQELRSAILARLGVEPLDPQQDTELVTALESALLTKTVMIDRLFFDWRGGRRRGPSPADEAYGSDPFARFAEQVSTYRSAVSLDHPYWSDPGPCSMHIDEVEAIWAAIDERDDWTSFYEKIDAIRRMGEAMRSDGKPC